MSSKIRNLLLILLLLLILAWTVWPAVLVATAGAIASAHGCQLDEGSVHACNVNGRDIGEQLFGMGVIGWFMLVTIPTGLLALAAYGAILLVIWLISRARRRNSRAKPA